MRLDDIVAEPHVTEQIGVGARVCHNGDEHRRAGHSKKDTDVLDFQPAHESAESKGGAPPMQRPETIKRVSPLQIRQADLANERNDRGHRLRLSNVAVVTAPLE